MRLKNIIYKVTLLLLVVGMASCTKWDEYSSDDDLASAPTVTVTYSDLGEESFTLNLSSTTSGYVSYQVVEGIDTVVPDGDDLLAGNVAGGIKGYAPTEEGGNSFLISGLEGNANYTVFAVSGNTDGIWSIVEPMYIHTEDFTNPELDGVAPGVSVDRDQDKGFTITLTYTEVVKIADTAEFTLQYFYDDVTVTVAAEDISVMANQVMISQSYEMYASEWIFFSIKDGSVLDLVGNPAEGVQTGVNDEGELEGIYWRIAEETVEISDDSFMPMAGSAVPSLDSLIVKFPVPMDITEYEDGDIKLKVYKTGQTVILDIPATNVVAVPEDSIVIVYNVATPDFGDYIAVEIAAGIFEDAYGNASGEYMSDMESGASWLVSYNRDINLLSGEYMVSGAELVSGKDSSFNVTLVVDDATSTISVTGLWGSDSTIVASFDKDFASFSIGDYWELGNISAANDTSDCTTYNYNANGGDRAGESIGFVEEDGSISFTNDYCLGVVDWNLASPAIIAVLSNTKWTKIVAP